MRIVMFGDGAWAANSLRRLHAEGHDVPAVVVRVRPSDGTLEAAARETGARVLRFERCAAPAALAEIEGLAPALGLSVSYNQIFRRALLDAIPEGIVNFHAGMLPRYRGRNVINWAILNGETEVGITAHHVDEGIDTGDIVLQRSVPVGWTDGYGDVLRRVVAAFPDLVADTVRLVASGNAPRVPQDHARGTYFGGRVNGDEWLDWSRSSRELHNTIRAITRPGPGARTLLGEREVVVWRAHYDPAWPCYTATPGEVVGHSPHGAAIVKTGDSTLQVLEAQMEGEPAARPRWPIGTRLGLDLASAVRALRRRLATLDATHDDDPIHASS